MGKLSSGLVRGRIPDIFQELLDSDAWFTRRHLGAWTIRRIRFGALPIQGPRPYLGICLVWNVGAGETRHHSALHTIEMDEFA